MSGTNTLTTTTGATLFRLAFEISPILLTGGVAQSIPGGALPIVTLTEAANFLDGLISSSFSVTNLDQFFAHFVPLPGSTLLDNKIGQYPFANQSVAANALINSPLTISLKMVCPAKLPGSYLAKLATITALKATLQTHANLGGLYTVATPSFIYQNAVLNTITDISDGSTAQAQFQYRFDFTTPLVTGQQAQTAQNNLMNKLTNGLPTAGQLSGTTSTLGNSLSGATSAVLPSATSAQGVLAPASIFSQILNNL